MSRPLLNPDIDIATIHSPVDDYWSFYFTAQWACVFHIVGGDEGDSAVLQRLRKLLAGNWRDRDAGTLTIVAEFPKVSRHGSFLTNIQPFLKDWYFAMSKLLIEWQEEEDKNPAAIFGVDAFQRYADKGLLSFLKVACDYYPKD